MAPMTMPTCTYLHIVTPSKQTKNLHDPDTSNHPSHEVNQYLDKVWE